VDAEGVHAEGGGAGGAGGGAHGDHSWRVVDAEGGMHRQITPSCRTLVRHDGVMPLIKSFACHNDVFKAPFRRRKARIWKRRRTWNSPCCSGVPSQLPVVPQVIPRLVCPKRCRPETALPQPLSLCAAAGLASRTSQGKLQGEREDGIAGETSAQVHNSAQVHTSAQVH